VNVEGEVLKGPCHEKFLFHKRFLNIKKLTNILFLTIPQSYQQHAHPFLLAAFRVLLLPRQWRFALFTSLRGVQHKYCYEHRSTQPSWQHTSLKIGLKCSQIWMDEILEKSDGKTRKNKCVNRACSKLRLPVYVLEMYRRLGQKAKSTNLNKELRLRTSHNFWKIVRQYPTVQGKRRALVNHV